ncbi:alpha/beta hydrolase [Streptomyces sp. NPDC046316]|uniref:alpha/beta fold hydrolase n=1 Tax=Streptomyces sp. NPDC046316 TaxID=3154494 RepID=UPI0033E497E3
MLATDAQLNEPDPAWREGLAAITSPTLILAGGAASHLAQERLSWMADRLPEGHLVTIGTGHEIHASRPAEFLTVIREFGI